MTTGDSFGNRGEKAPPMAAEASSAEEFREEDEVISNKPVETIVEDEPPPPPPPPRDIPPYHNVEELLTLTLPARSKHIDLRLKTNLTGSVGIQLSEGQDVYVFDWSTDPFSFKKVSGGVTPAPDCIIKLSGAHLMKIASGDLNPQIAMLSDKIRIEGKAGIAVYFFNLVVGRGR